MTDNLIHGCSGFSGGPGNRALSGDGGHPSQNARNLGGKYVRNCTLHTR